MDAGSGAKRSSTLKMISHVTRNTKFPLIAGGAMNTIAKAPETLQAGPDTIVVGNGIEKDPQLLIEISDYIRGVNEPLKIH